MAAPGGESQGVAGRRPGCCCRSLLARWSVLAFSLSLVLPLYHVALRVHLCCPSYASGSTGLALAETRRQVVVWIAAACGGSAFSIFQMHTRPEYAADGGVAIAFLSEQWRPGDAV